jgi:CubicO group peptidase (beta-lactamase class C family)
MPAMRAFAPLMLVLSLGCAGRIAVPAANPQPAGNDPSLQALVETIRTETQVPGIAVAVVAREGVIATAAAGVRRTDEASPLQSSDTFHLGSDTKAMTAFLVARLVERGALSWEMTLGEAFPQWSSSMNEAYRQVRLMDLLRHRAGMPAFTSAADLGLLDGIDFDAPVVEQRLAFASNVLHRAPVAAPGEKFLYSNAGYMVVGSILEKRLGKPWEALMQEELFAPLEMASCGFGPPATGSARGQPFGHRAKDAASSYVPTDSDNPPLVGPAGTVHCSLADWASFVRANMDAPPQPLLERETVALLHDGLPIGKEDIAYAMGWGSAERPWAAGKVLSHDGSNGSNLAAVRLAPRRGLAFLIAVNAGDERADQAVQRAYEALTARYAPVETAAPRRM